MFTTLTLLQSIRHFLECASTRTSHTSMDLTLKIRHIKYTPHISPPTSVTAQQTSSDRAGPSHGPSSRTDLHPPPRTPSPHPALALGTWTDPPARLRPTTQTSRPQPLAFARASGGQAFARPQSRTVLSPRRTHVVVVPHVSRDVASCDSSTMHGPVDVSGASGR